MDCTCSSVYTGHCAVFRNGEVRQSGPGEYVGKLENKARDGAVIVASVALHFIQKLKCNAHLEK